jgi:hypothetical protein
MDWIHIDSDDIDVGNGDVQVIINYYYDKESMHYPHNSTFLIFDRKDKNIVRVRTKTEYVTPLNYENSIVAYCINLIEIDCVKRTYTQLDSKYYSEDNVKRINLIRQNLFHLKCISNPFGSIYAINATKLPIEIK